MRDVMDPQIEPVGSIDGLARTRSILVTVAEPSEIRRDTHRCRSGVAELDHGVSGESQSFVGGQGWPVAAPHQLAGPVGLAVGEVGDQFGQAIGVRVPEVDRVIVSIVSRRWHCDRSRRLEGGPSGPRLGQTD
jgi:hypothetical protein